MAIKSNAIKDASGKIRKVQVGSEAEKKYLSGGGSIIKGAEGAAAKKSRSNELKDLNHPGSPTYIDQDAIPDGPAVPETPVPGIGTQAPSTLQAPKPNATSLATQYGQSRPLSISQMTGMTNNPPVPNTPVENKYRTGFEAAQASGIPAPTTGGTAATAPYIPPAPQPTIADDLFANSEDGFFADLQTQLQDYFNPKTQRESLTKEYQKMIKKSGIEDLDMELIDMKNIIEGTEDDIRTEITKAGGFATDSQVVAMTNARNKQLIKNYNTLLETRNSKEQYLDKMMDLTVEDRRQADAQFDRMMNVGFQIANYRNQMKQNAAASYNRLADKMGYDGLLQQASGDPNSIALIEKTLGIGSGGLSKLAAIDAHKRAQEEMLFNLDIKAKNATIANANRVTYQAVKGDDGKIYSFNPTTGNLTPISSPNSIGDPIQMARAETDISTINNLIKDKALAGSVGPGGLQRLGPIVSFTGAKQNFIAEVEKIIAGLSLDTLIQAKKEGATFGALSEGEMRVLSNAASKIGKWRVEAVDREGNKTGDVIGYAINETNFKNELQTISNFSKLDYVLKGGDPAMVGGTITPDGLLSIPNWDGSVETFKL